MGIPKEALRSSNAFLTNKRPFEGKRTHVKIPFRLLHKRSFVSERLSSLVRVSQQNDSKSKDEPLQDASESSFSTNDALIYGFVPLIIVATSIIIILITNYYSTKRETSKSKGHSGKCKNQKAPRSRFRYQAKWDAMHHFYFDSKVTLSNSHINSDDMITIDDREETAAFNTKRLKIGASGIDGRSSLPIVQEDCLNYMDIPINFRKVRNPADYECNSETPSCAIAFPTKYSIPCRETYKSLFIKDAFDLFPCCLMRTVSFPNLHSSKRQVNSFLEETRSYSSNDLINLGKECDNLREYLNIQGISY